MFRGQFEHSIDAKGRLSIPAKFRDVLQARASGRLVVTNHDRCVYAYAFPDFEEIEKKLASAPQTEVQRAFIRRFIGGAHECDIDNTGRILVPPPLRAYASLSRDVMLVGGAKHFEIWALDRWKAEDAKNEQLVAANRDFIPDI
ncbi:MAG TPA: division/cell wall cluster transcriptional repressor MraZ [bacterium]|nr:division/cell wall cluster transcriptional repressor MraZ [bacterium]